MGENSLIPVELLNILAETAANAGVEAYKKEKENDEKNRKSNKIKEVKKLLGGYRRIKTSLAEEAEFTEEEKTEYRWKFVEDLMGSARSFTSRSERIVQDEEKRRQENLYSMYRIENAMELYRRECELASNDEEKRRYREVYAMYIADEAKTVPELALEENISEKTVYRDIGIAYQILAIYLFGI